MSNTTAKATPRKTTLMPVTTMEEVPVYTKTERAEMLASLKEAEADIAAGRFIELNADEIEPWLKEKLRKARAKKQHGV